MSHIMRKTTFAYAKTKAQICFAVPMKLISAFDFATGIVQFLYFNNPKFPPLAIFCACTGRFVPDLIKNHIDGFLVLGFSDRV